jgi:hypothetical protein
MVLFQVVYGPTTTHLLPTMILPGSAAAEVLCIRAPPVPKLAIIATFDVIDGRREYLL